MSEATTQKLKPSEDEQAMELAAQMITDGKSITEALRAAGYSEQTALQGVRSIPTRLWEKLTEKGLAKGDRFAKLGEKIDLQRVSNTIKGRLYNNIVTGEYKGESAAKLLGSMRDYNLFTPDSVAGLIVLQAPTTIQAGKPLQLPDGKDFEDV